MLPLVAFSSFLFIIAGVVSFLIGGEFFTSLSAVVYGIIDILWHECAHGNTSQHCQATVLYDMGLLSVMDSFLQHTIIVYALTSILFSSMILRTLSRWLLTSAAFFAMFDWHVNEQQADLLTSGMYLGLWLIAYILREHPPRNLKWTALLFVSYALGYVLTQSQHIITDTYWRDIALSIAHLSFAFGIVCAACALRFVKIVKKS